ncbi:MAG: hypothetical protein CBC73_01365 [Flavobacteriales bacterium TMED113]|mgnify:CR=1 FL=1|nr:MAG: hypothetical protein CBC73_01365 [Flavobacteriales bacterium TMED113]
MFNHKKIYIMDKVFSSFKTFIGGLTGLMMSLLGLGIVAEVLFGSQDGWLNVMDNIGSFVERFAEGGFIGLVALCIVLALVNKK